MRIFLLVLMLIGPCTILYIWIHNANHELIMMLRLLPQKSIQASYSATSKHWALLVCLIPAVFGMAVLFSFSVIFKYFSQGDFFTGKSIACFKRVGALILLWELIHPLYDILMGAALSSPHLWSSTFIEFDISNLRGLIIGIVLFIIAQVLGNAQKLKNELDLTV